MEYKTPHFIDHTALYYYFDWNLTVCVNAQDKTEIYFKLKITIKIQKLMDAYRADIAIEDNTSRSIPDIFIFNGIHIKATDTPKSLSM